MKNVLTIIKKEFSRFFKDRRMVITVLLPGLLIYLLYSIMGSVFSDMNTVDPDYKLTACVYEMPQSLSEGFNEMLDISEDEITLEEAKEMVSEGTLDIVVVFPDGFDNVIYGSEIGVQPPDVAIYYNSSDEKSAAGYYSVKAVLDKLNSSKFTINANGDFDLATERDTVGKILSTLMPLLMFALLSSSCVAVAPESIAGEKERGSMATMLITPIKRWQIAIGKIISLTCFAMLSGISSFLGVILSLPKLMGGFIGTETAVMYSAGDYLMIFALIISVVLVIISAFSVLSAVAKSVKEAGLLITPVMMVVILLGLCAMFVTGTPVLGLYAVPLMGSGLALASIMSFSVNGIAVLLSIISNLILAAVFVVLLALMFKSEKIMFSK